jgi:MT0933-like antitoxin protein
MGFMDKVKGMLGGHADQTDKGIERGGDMLDDRTGGKYADKTDKGQEAARDALRRMDEGGRGEGGTS